MDTLKKVGVEFICMPTLFVLNLAFAWMPMLGWNLGIVAIFPELPKIDYMTAFWASYIFRYITTTVVSFKPVA